MKYERQTIAITRIVTGIYFFLFGEYKVFTDTFRNGGLQRAITSYINEQSVAFYKPFLAGVVQPHITAWSYAIGIGELLIGISLITGLFVRPASVFGAIHMISLTLATWNGAGAGVAFWRVAANQLGHIPMLLLLAIFFAGDAGTTWGLARPRREAK